MTRVHRRLGLSPVDARLSLRGVLARALRAAACEVARYGAAAVSAEVALGDHHRTLRALGDKAS